MSNFINGTTYTKYVPDFNHSSVNDSQCTYVGPVDSVTNDNSSSLKFVCFESDPIWGGVSLAFMFVPGLAVLFFWFPKDHFKGFNYLTCLALPFFPIALICVKTIALFNPGPNWKILAERFAVAEGEGESQYQFYLQLFIVFSRADRSPSSVQMVTIATSFLMLIKVRIDAILMKQAPLDTWWSRGLRVASLAPRCLAGQVFFAGLMSLLATLLRYWFLIIWFLIIFASSLVFNRAIWPKKENTNIRFQKINIGKIQIKEQDIKTEMRDRIAHTMFLLVLSAMVITANLSPGLTIPGLFWQVWTS